MKKGAKVALLAAILIPSTILGYVLVLNGNPLNVNFNGVIGYAKLGGATPNSSGPNAAQSSSGSELIKGLLADGSLKDVFSANMSISHAAISPLGELYIHTFYVLERSMSLAGSGGNLLIRDRVTSLLKINLTSNEITPVISVVFDGISTPWADYGIKSFDVKGDYIQFDAKGNCYLIEQNLHNYHCSFVKYSPKGDKTVLMEGPFTINQFLVTPSGNFIIEGKGVQNGDSSWLRYVEVGKPVKNLLINIDITAMMWFPDGNIYFTESAGMRRIYINGTLDSKLWISLESENSYFKADDGYYAHDGNNKYIYTENGEVFQLSVNKMYQVFPTYKMINTTITQYQTGIAVGSRLYLSGTDNSLNNRFITYDIETEGEQVLLPTENIDIYQMDWSASQNTLFFSGLNFNDITQVIGKYYPSNGSYSLSNTGSSSQVYIDVFG